MKTIFVASLALVSCLAVAQGYDFSDPDFNALLAADYAEFMSDNIPEELLTNYRAKRDAPCHGPGGGHKKEFPSQRCCKEAIENPESLDKIKEMKKECFSRIKENRTEIETEMDAFSCDRLQKKKAEIRCAYECILKKQLMFTEDGQVDEKAALEYFRKELVDTPWVKDNLEKIVTDCAAEGSKDAEPTPAAAVGAAGDKKEAKQVKEVEEVEEEKCSQKPMKFLFCMWREYTKKCPTDQQKDTKTCNLIREGKLEFVHHGHHHHGHHHHHHD